MSIFEYLAKLFETDVKTVLLSITNGTFSTAVGIELGNRHLLTVGSINFELEKHIVSLFWAAATCIVVTVLSFCLNETMKAIRSRIQKRKDKKDV